jgi:ribosomal protein S18 acetylase RimI-like enzyme
MFTCRLVLEEDLPLICSFPQSEQELFFMFPKADYPLSVDQLKEAIHQRFDSTVVLLDGEVVGFANFYVCEEDVKCAIGNVIVSPKVRGKGAGRFLIKHMLHLAFDLHHVKQVEISCFNQNVTGLILYVKMGFKPVSIEERIDKQGSRVALIHMRMLKEGMTND